MDLQFHSLKNIKSSIKILAIQALVPMIKILMEEKVNAPHQLLEKKKDLLIKDKIAQNQGLALMSIKDLQALKSVLENN